MIPLISEFLPLACRSPWPQLQSAQSDEARPGLLRMLGRRTPAEPLPPLRADELMTPGVLSGPAHTPVAEALRQMLAQKRKRFVVADEAGRPQGLVDRQLLLHALSGAA